VTELKKLDTGIPYHFLDAAAAGTIAAKDIPDNCVVGGVPAKKIKDL